MRSSGYQIAELSCRAGWLGIGPVPGRGGTYEADLSAIFRWGAALVLTMTTSSELERCGAGGLGTDLEAGHVAWRHLPISDFGAPQGETDAAWPEASLAAHAVLANGGRVFSHCYGGCGRSGMALLRLMIEAGEDVDRALERLRSVRSCAVETEGQKAWAAIAMHDRQGWSL